MSEVAFDAETADTAAGRLARTIHRGTPILLVILGLMLYLGARFHVAINDQSAKCLPPYKVFLVDRHDRTIDRGGIYAFFAGERMAPFFAPEMLVIKQVVGGPGDRVQVTEATTKVNAETVGAGLDLAKTLGKPEEQLVRELEVPQDALWIMGATRDSFDSRYWGPLPMHQIIGRAYALF
jgi:conjugal transfer pilin signal peptidase TrbI